MIVTIYLTGLILSLLVDIITDSLTYPEIKKPIWFTVIDYLIGCILWPVVWIFNIIASITLKKNKVYVYRLTGENLYTLRKKSKEKTNE